MPLLPLILLRPDSFLLASLKLSLYALSFLFVPRLLFVTPASVDMRTKSFEFPALLQKLPSFAVSSFSVPSILLLKAAFAGIGG